MTREITHVSMHRSLDGWMSDVSLIWKNCRLSLVIEGATLCSSGKQWPVQWLGHWRVVISDRIASRPRPLGETVPNIQLEPPDIYSLTFAKGPNWIKFDYIKGRLGEAFIYQKHAHRDSSSFYCMFHPSLLITKCISASKVEGRLYWAKYQQRSHKLTFPSSLSACVGKS